MCTPYHPPSKANEDLEDLVKTKLPNFAYQLQLASGEVEKRIQTKEQMTQFLTAVYGGRTPEGASGFDVGKGILFENLPSLKPSRLLSPAMLAYYTEQYMRNGIHGTCKYNPNLQASSRSTHVAARVRG